MITAPVQAVQAVAARPMYTLRPLLGQRMRRATGKTARPQGAHSDIQQGRIFTGQVQAVQEAAAKHIRMHLNHHGQEVIPHTGNGVRTFNAYISFPKVPIHTPVQAVQAAAARRIHTFRLPAGQRILSRTGKRAQLPAAHINIHQVRICSVQARIVSPAPIRITMHRQALGQKMRRATGKAARPQVAHISYRPGRTIT